MAENNFRSYRNRDPSARSDFDPAARDAGGDPLAELARLIGQGDPNAAYGRDAGHGAPESLDDAGPAAGLDWAANEGYAEQDQHAKIAAIPNSPVQRTATSRHLLPRPIRRILPIQPIHHPTPITRTSRRRAANIPLPHRHSTVHARMRGTMRRRTPVTRTSRSRRCRVAAPRRL